MSDVALTWFERLRAWIERWLSPGLGTCYRCRRPWISDNWHATPYGRGRGCFPLCERCWAMLTPDERLPYYEALWRKWSEYGTDVPLAVIRAACFYESPRVEVNSLDEAFRRLNNSPEKYKPGAYGGTSGVWYLIPYLAIEVRQARETSSDSERNSI